MKNPVAASPETYDRARAHFIAALERCQPAQVVPACPGWTVHDLLAHQVHQLHGALSGSFPIDDALAAIMSTDPRPRAAARERQDEWTRAGIDRLRGRSLSSLVDQWDALCEQSDPAVRGALVPDLVVHLFDLLGVVPSRELRDDPMVEEALTFWKGCAPGAHAVPEQDAFELLRVLTGRRSKEQAPWAPDDLAVYGWRRTPLDE